MATPDSMPPTSLTIPSIPSDGGVGEAHQQPDAHPPAGETMVSPQEAPAGAEEAEEEPDHNGVTQSLPPSHILEDGRFIYLPPPSAPEKSRFFERSIARHGLLQADMGKKNATDGNDDTDDDGNNNNKQAKEEEDKTAPRIHPLAVASARLQANGLAELNRAINLSQLVSMGEYFGLSNIVDPSLEATDTPGREGRPGANAAASQQVDAIKSTFVLKRKRSQFQKASIVLERHEKRLRAAIRAQKVLDRRLFQLRQQWRLVAPEHGTRARLHAARPTEIVAVDVDVYDRDRVGGGNQALKTSVGQQQSLAGRLASRVPRFATIELRDDFKLQEDDSKKAPTGDDGNNDNNDDTNTKNDDTTKDDSVPQPMEIDEKNDVGAKGDATNDSDEKAKEGETKATEISQQTRAEPFAVADPTLGRVMENFDPSKVPMLNLQLDIQKSSTGFSESSCLEPMTTLSVAQGETTNYSQDEELLVSLQHSLFCASLFESIRSELDPPSEKNPTQFSPVQRNLPPVAWLSCESEENFLPPPNRVVGGGHGLASLSIVHCHEGEVKVQLDSEYTLCVKLVEANVETEKSKIKTPPNPSHDSDAGARSGSQSPQQLQVLCQALLLHAQDVYHRHSLYLRERAKKKEEEEKAKGDAPRGLARISKEDVPDKARILQSCVSLGAKMLFEQRVRKALVRIARWLKYDEGTTEKIVVHWLALSIFDVQSQFTLAFRAMVWDVNITRDSMVVSRIAEGGEHRKVQFHSDSEFEIFLKMQLRRELRHAGE